MNQCIRTIPYGVDDKIPLCSSGSCACVLLPNEKVCACCAPHQNEAECKHNKQTAKWVCDDCGQSFKDMQDLAHKALTENEAEWAEFDRTFPQLVGKFLRHKDTGEELYLPDVLKAFIKERFVPRTQIAEVVEELKKEGDWRKIEATYPLDAATKVKQADKNIVYNAALEALKAKLINPNKHDTR